MKIIKFILGRLGRSIFSLIMVLIICFVLMRLLPTDVYFGDRIDKMSEATKQGILQDLGLLDPIPKQMYNYFEKIITKWDFGNSLTYYAGRPVWKVIQPKIKYSVCFGLASLGLSLIFGMGIGVLMTNFKGRFLDKMGNGYILFISAVPAIVYYLFIQLIGTDMLKISMIFSATNPKTWILPAISMSLGGTAYYAMWIRRYMVDQINQDYVKLAKAKGLKRQKVMMNHVFRNAFVPMAQYLPTSILYTITGSLYIESLYSIPGMGSLLVNAITAQDNNLIQALVLFYATLSVLGMLLGDIAMAICDPRIKLVKKEAGR